MSWCIKDAETGTVIHGGMTYNEALLFREKCHNSDSYLIEKEPEEMQ